MYLIDLLTILHIALPIHSRSEWTSAPYPNSSACSKTHKPTEIVVHHTATQTNDMLTTQARLNLIRESHLARNFCDIGYHFLIDREGNIWRGVPSELIRGSHVKGLNTGRIGIAMIGNYDIYQPTDRQLAAMRNLISSLRHKYSITGEVKVHRDYSNTVCAGRNLICKVKGK